MRLGAHKYFCHYFGEPMVALSSFHRVCLNMGKCVEIEVKYAIIVSILFVFIECLFQLWLVYLLQCVAPNVPHKPVSKVWPHVCAKNYVPVVLMCLLWLLVNLHPELLGSLNRLCWNRCVFHSMPELSRE